MPSTAFDHSNHSSRGAFVNEHMNVSIMVSAGVDSRDRDDVSTEKSGSLCGTP